MDVTGNIFNVFLLQRKAK